MVGLTSPDLPSACRCVLRAVGTTAECEKGTSIPDYEAVWAGLPPTSPVSGVSSPLVDVVLLPMGATDLRVAEFATTAQ